MIRLSRFAKGLLSVMMTPLLLWSLYAATFGSADGDTGDGADSLVLRLILLELYSLEASAGADASAREVKLGQLALRLQHEVSLSPGDAVLQAENIILREAAGAGDSSWMALLGLHDEFDIPDPELRRLMLTLYSEDGEQAPDAALFLEIMGDSWFSLTALIQYGERHRDQTLTAEFRARLSERSLSVVTTLERLGLFVGCVCLGGLWVWGRYFLVLRRRNRPRLERVLPRAEWSALDGYFVFLLFFCLFSAAASLMPPLMPDSGLGLPPGLAVPLFYSLQVFTGIFLLQRFFFPGNLVDSWHRMGGVLGDGWLWKAAAWGIGGYAATMPLVLTVLFLTSRIMGSPPVSSNPLIPLMMEAATLGEQLLFFLTVAVLAPVFEEVFFRGFLFNAFRARFGAPVGMVLSSLLFGLVHFDFAMFPGLFAIGLVLCFVYYHTQSLAAPMLLHGVWNTTTLVVVHALFP